MPKNAIAPEKNSHEINGELYVKTKGVVSDSWSAVHCIYNNASKAFSHSNGDKPETEHSQQLQRVCCEDVANRPGKRQHRFNVLELKPNGQVLKQLELAAEFAEEKQRWTAAITSAQRERARLQEAHAARMRLLQADEVDIDQRQSKPSFAGKRLNLSKKEPLGPRVEDDGFAFDNPMATSSPKRSPSTRAATAKAKRQAAAVSPPVGASSLTGELTKKATIHEDV
jgi:hypothetical protein